MRRSIIVAVILILLASTSGFAGFGIGANAGIGMSDYTGFDPAEPDDTSIGLSGQIGAEFQFSFIPILGLKLNINYIKYSASIKTVSDEYSLNYSYLDFCLALNISISKFNIYAGGFLGVLLDAYQENNGIETSLSDYTNTTVGGFLVGLAYNIGLGPIKLPIGIEFKYILSDILDLDKGVSFTHKAWALHFKIGILFGL